MQALVFYQIHGIQFRENYVGDSIIIQEVTNTF